MASRVSHGETMTKAAQLVMNEALALPPIDRASIIEGLISSFSPNDREAVDQAWAREAEARISAYDAGILTSRPLGEFIAQVNQK